ncbi:MAG: sulfotransferase domain-containing protein [Limisphaerales bacterium]
MRFLLTDVLLQAHGVETKTELPVHPDNLIPEFRCDSLLSRFARCPHWARERPTVFVKSHFLFARLAQMLSLDGRRGFGMQPGGRAPYRDCRILYLYRSPEDALVSVYHLKHDDDYARGRAIHGLDDFCRIHASRWMETMKSYFRAADDGVPVFFVSYEQMVEGTTLALGETLRWLGLPHDSQMVERAVSNMQFGKLQAMETQANKTSSPAGKQSLFFRRGGVGSGCAELQESTVREIRERTASLLCEANLRRMKQLSMHPAPALGTPIPLETEGLHRNGESKDANVPLRALGV